MTGRREERDRGAVTAELATALLTVVLLLAGVLAAAQVGQAQLRCVDAASAGARAAARGEDHAHVVALAGRLAGRGAAAAVTRDGELARVTVRRVLVLPLPGTPAVPLQASAAVPVEPGAGHPAAPAATGAAAGWP